MENEIITIDGFAIGEIYKNTSLSDMTGETWKNGRSKKVLCVETGIVFPSAREAERQTGAHQQHIIKCCQGKYGYKTAGGYHWKYFIE